MTEQTRISDEGLFIRYAEGDGQAFRELMDRYADRLVRFCRGYVSSGDTAEDLVQETFLRAIRSAGTYRATDRFSTWIHTIARNLCLDHLKVRGRRAELRRERDQEITETTMGNAPAGAAAVTGGLDAEGTRQDLERALEALTPLEAETIRLTFFADWSSRQIAELQQCSTVTVRARRHQAIEKMRGRLLDAPHPGHGETTLRERNGRER